MASLIDHAIYPVLLSAHHPVFGKFKACGDQLCLRLTHGTVIGHIRHHTQRSTEGIYCQIDCSSFFHFLPDRRVKIQDNALRDIRECQHTLAEMAVQRDRQIDSIKADYAQGALPLQNRVKALESEVKAYVDLHRAELDGKSRALNFGTVGYRVSSKLMLASSRVAEAIATLKVLGHTELIKTTETLDREALKRQPGDILQQVGAYIRTVDEFYYDVSSKEADA